MIPKTITFSITILAFKNISFFINFILCWNKSLNPKTLIWLKIILENKTVVSKYQFTLEILVGSSMLQWVTEVDSWRPTACVANPGGYRQLQQQLGPCEVESVGRRFINFVIQPWGRGYHTFSFIWESGSEQEQKMWRNLLKEYIVGCRGVTQLGGRVPVLWW